MKIIRAGQKPDERAGRFVCQQCKSVVEAQVKEANRRETSYQGTFLTFNCPVCKKLTCTNMAAFFRNLDADLS